MTRLNVRIYHLSVDQEPLPVRPEGPAGSFLMCGDRDLRYEGTMASAWAWVR